MATPSDSRCPYCDYGCEACDARLLPPEDKAKCPQPDDALRDEMRKAMRDSETGVVAGVHIIATHHAVAVAVEKVREAQKINEAKIRDYIDDAEDRAVRKWGHVYHCQCHGDGDRCVNVNHNHPYRDSNCAPAPKEEG